MPTNKVSSKKSRRKKRSASSRPSNDTPTKTTKPSANTTLRRMTLLICLAGVFLCIGSLYLISNQTDTADAGMDHFVYGDLRSEGRPLHSLRHVIARAENSVYIRLQGTEAKAAFASLTDSIEGLPWLSVIPAPPESANNSAIIKILRAHLPMLSNSSWQNRPPAEKLPEFISSLQRNELVVPQGPLSLEEDPLLLINPTIRKLNNILESTYDPRSISTDEDLLLLAEISEAGLNDFGYSEIESRISALLATLSGQFEVTTYWTGKIRTIVEQHSTQMSHLFIVILAGALGIAIMSFLFLRLLMFSLLATGSYLCLIGSGVLSAPLYGFDVSAYLLLLATPLAAVGAVSTTSVLLIQPQRLGINLNKPEAQIAYLLRLSKGTFSFIACALAGTLLIEGQSMSLMTLFISIAAAQVLLLALFERCAAKGAFLTLPTTIDRRAVTLDVLCRRLTLPAIFPVLGVLAVASLSYTYWTLPSDYSIDLTSYSRGKHLNEATKATEGLKQLSADSYIVLQRGNQTQLADAMLSLQPTLEKLKSNGIISDSTNVGAFFSPPEEQRKLSKDLRKMGLTQSEALSKAFTANELPDTTVRSVLSAITNRNSDLLLPFDFSATPLGSLIKHYTFIRGNGVVGTIPLYGVHNPTKAEAALPTGTSIISAEKARITRMVALAKNWFIATLTILILIPVLFVAWYRNKQAGLAGLSLVAATAVAILVCGLFSLSGLTSWHLAGILAGTITMIPSRTLTIEFPHASAHYPLLCCLATCSLAWLIAPMILPGIAYEAQFALGVFTCSVANTLITLCSRAKTMSPSG